MTQPIWSVWILLMTTTTNSDAMLFQPLRFRPLGDVIVPSSTDKDLAAPAALALEISHRLRDQEWLLAPSQHVEFPSTLIDNLETKRLFSPADFFHLIEKSTNEELKDVALDENGNQKQLLPEQWKDMKETGEFNVPSARFVNQNHRWRVTPAFYSGDQRRWRTFRQGVGRALDHFICHTRSALFGWNNNEAVSQWWNGFIRGFQTLLKAILQIPGYPLLGRTHDDEWDLEQLEQCAEYAHVVYNLKQENLDTRIVAVPRALLMKMDVAGEEQWETLKRNANWTLPEIQLLKQEITNQSKYERQLQVIRQKFDRSMRERRTRELKIDLEHSRKNPAAAFQESEDGELAWERQVERYWIEELRSDAINETVAADKVQASQIAAALQTSDAKEMDQAVTTFSLEVKKNHPILSLSKIWHESQVDAFRHEKRATLKASFQDRLLEQLRGANLTLPTRIEELRREFAKSDRQAIHDRLISVRYPNVPAKFEILQLNPKRWYRAASGQLCRHREVVVECAHYFWRLPYTWYLFLSTTMSLWGGAYHFLVSGPLSMRALFSRRPFYALQKIRDNGDGTGHGTILQTKYGTLDLESDPFSFTPTLWSRLTSYHKSLSDARRQFEASPDIGLIGKNIQRPFLRARLLAASVVGTTMITAFMFIGSVLATAINLSIILLGPVLSAVWTIVVTLFHLIIADRSSLGPALQIAIVVPYHFVVQGCLKLLWSLLRGIIIHPIIGTLQLGWSSFRLAFRNARDFLTWHLVIRQTAKVPAADSFLAKRIQGPGLASAYFYHIPLGAAKRSIQLALDSFRIHAHATLRRAEILEPFHRYEALFEEALREFGFVLRLGERHPERIMSEIQDKWLRKANNQWKESDFVLTYVKIVLGTPYSGSGDFWDSLADRIRSVNPDFKKAVMENTPVISEDYPKLSNRNKAILDAVQGSANQTGSSMDRAIFELLPKHNVLPRGSQIYRQMASRAGSLLAELSLQEKIREARTSEASAIPSQLVGKIRLTTHERDQLWEFALKKTEECYSVTSKELLELAQHSAFPEQLTRMAKSILEQFFTRSGGRPGQDIPLVAAHILAKLFGRETVVETIEDVEKSLVLMPTKSDFEKHLRFGLFENSDEWVTIYSFQVTGSVDEITISFQMSPQGDSEERNVDNV